MSQQRIYLYKRYERFWHWTQALLIIVMLLTGFEVHGSYQLIGFAAAAKLHSLAAWALLVLWAFTVFWHFTTGEWRQYRPSARQLGSMVRYYALDIFRGAAHPYRKTAAKKHNPLQRLTYLALLALILPLIWGSGLLYLFYGDWRGLGLSSSSGGLSLAWVANLHVAAAYLVAAFICVHVYLTTTGHTVFAHIKAMISGWEELDADEAGGETGDGTSGDTGDNGNTGGEKAAASPARASQ